MPLDVQKIFWEGANPYAPSQKTCLKCTPQRLALGFEIGHRRGTMGRIVLVTGGARSGKSRFAESLCLQANGPYFYLATCPRIPGDTDLDARIEAHKFQRAGKNWITKEEPLQIEAVLKEAQECGASVLLECLGLWVGNLIYQGITDRNQAELDLRSRVQNICAQWRNSPGTLVIVGQEAGWGILPAEKESRLWLDLLGCCRNTMAQDADEVWLVASGIQLCLKPQQNQELK